MSTQASLQTPVLELLAGGSCLTTAQLTQGVGVDRRKVATACGKLVSRGWIVRRERGCFVLSAEGRRALDAGETITSGPNGPLSQDRPRRNRKQTDRDLIWRTIRIQQKFSVADLETVSGASRDNVSRYVWALEKAGYLIKLRREPGTSPTSNGFGRWTLINDPGGLPPIWRPRRREVYDPNSGHTIEVSR